MDQRWVLARQDHPELVAIGFWAEHCEDLVEQPRSFPRSPILWLRSCCSSAADGNLSMHMRKVADLLLFFEDGRTAAGPGRRQFGNQEWEWSEDRDTAGGFQRSEGWIDYRPGAVEITQQIC